MGTIITKYHGPTNHRGSQIIATAKRHCGNYSKISVSWDSSLNILDNHTEAAMKLARQIEWFDQWIASDTNDGNGYVFTRASKLRYQEIYSHQSEEESMHEHVERLIQEAHGFGLRLVSRFADEEA